MSLSASQGPDMHTCVGRSREIPVECMSEGTRICLRMCVHVLLGEICCVCVAVWGVCESECVLWLLLLVAGRRVRKAKDEKGEDVTKTLS